MMSPAERKYWLLAQRRVAGMQPDVQRALLRAFQIIRDSFTDAELTRVIDSGNIDRLFAEALNEATMDRAFLPYRDKIRRSTERGFKFATADLPKAGKVDGVLAVAFDHLSPNVVTAIRALETKAMQGLKDDIRETVRAFVENGIRDGKNPRVIGRQLRTVIGMSPTQEANAVKREAALRAEGTMTEDQIAKAMETYRRRAVSLNAETNARTATLDAYKQGQHLAWQDARDKGVVPADAQLVKSWKGVMDDRERDEHVMMEGETVPFDSLYSNGNMIPGDDTYNCRCLSLVSVAT